jgi:hypothetical protein
MDETLQSFLWDDPVAHKFKADYEEQFQPLKEKLLPAMEKYEGYLKDLAGLSDVYTENSSPSLSAFAAAAAGAGVVGIAGVGAAAAGISVGQNATVGATTTKFSGSENSSFAAMSANTFDANERPAPDPGRQKEIKKILSDDYQDGKKDMFNTNGHLQIQYLEDTFNEYYDLKDKKRNNTVTIELIDDQRKQGDKYAYAGYYDPRENKIYLNENVDWTNEKLINTVAHEYYHAYDAKLENQIKKLEKEKTKLEKEKKFWDDFVSSGSNVDDNAKVKQKNLARIKGELETNGEKLMEAKKPLDYHDVPEDCFNENKQFRRDIVTCSKHEEKYNKSPEEQEARLRGESAGAAYREFAPNDNRIDNRGFKFRKKQ